MEKSEILEAVKAIKASKKRKFNQSIDLIIVLKDIDIKNAEQRVDFFAQLPHDKGKKVKICALVGGELIEQAKKVCDTAVLADDFPKYQADKKLTKKLAEDYDIFIAQATIMPKIATTFGKVFGPKGKMPNPKAGCVVPPNANLQPLYDRLQKTIRIITKNAPMVQVMVGKEEMKDEDVVDNVMTAYNQALTHLPNEVNNIKKVMLKLTMGKPVRVGGNTEESEEAKEKPAKVKAEKESEKEEKAPDKSGEKSEEAELKEQPEKTEAKSEAEEKPEESGSPEDQ